MDKEEHKTMPKLWSFIFIRIGIVTCLAGICRQMFIQSFPQYLKMQNFSATAIGFVATGYTISAMLSRIISGNLIDKKGRRVILLLGLVLFGLPVMGLLGLSAFGLTGIAAAAIIVFCRVFQGVGSSFTSIATGTMAPDVLPKERMAEGIGYYGLFNSLATAVGPAIGLGLLVDGKPDMFFFVSLLMIVIAVPISLTLNYEKKEKNSKEIVEEETEPVPVTNEKHRFSIWDVFYKKALPSTIVLSFISISSASISNFLAPYAISMGITSIGRFFTVQAIFTIISRLVSGKIAKRIGMFKTLLIGFCLDICAYTLLFTMVNPTMMYVAAAFKGLGMGINMPLLNVFAVQNAQKHERGKATSTYYIAFDIGAGLGSPFWGIIVDHIGSYRPIYAMAAMMYGITAILAYNLIGKRLKKEKQA